MARRRSSSLGSQWWSTCAMQAVTLSMPQGDGERVAFALATAAVTVVLTSGA